MEQRRTNSRMPSAPGFRLLSLRCEEREYVGQAIDESEGGLGIQVLRAVHLHLGDTVLVHRFHSPECRKARVCYLTHFGEHQTHVGIKWEKSAN